MTINLHSALREAKNRLSTDETWIFLLEVHLNGGAEIMRLARSTEQVTFNSLVYEPFPFQIGDIHTDGDGNLLSVDLAVMDVTGALRAALNQFDYDGAKVILRLVETGGLATASRVLDQDFQILGVRGTYEQLVFSLGHPDFMLQIFPGRSFLRTRCSWPYKGTECGYAGALSSCDRTLEGINGCRVHANQTRFGGAPAVPYGRNL